MSASVVEADNARRERARAEEQRDLAQKANAAARTAEQIASEQAAIAALKESEATTSAEQAARQCGSRRVECATGPGQRRHGDSHGR